MKKMKLAVFFAALVSVLSFSSCLDTNSESAYDGIALVTVQVMSLLAINYTQMEVESWFLQLLI